MTAQKRVKTLKRFLLTVLSIAVVFGSFINTVVYAASEYNYNKTGYSIIDENGNVTENNFRIPNDSANVPNTITKIAANPYTISAIDEKGILYIWGYSYNGAVDKLPKIKDVCAGQDFVAALDVLGRIHIIYDNNEDKLVIPETSPSFVSIDADTFKLTALTKDGTSYEFGAWASVYPQDLKGLKSVSSGVWISAAITKDDNIYIAGHSQYAPPLMESKPVMIASGRQSVLALGENGVVYGNVTHYFSNRAFYPKPKLENIVKIEACDGNAAAIDKDGRLSVWGEYTKARKAGEAVIDIPQNLPRVKDIVLAGSYAAAVGTDNKIYTWGLCYVTLPDKINGFYYMRAKFKEVDLSGITETMDIYSFKEFEQAISNAPICKKVNVKADIEIPYKELYIDGSQTINIDEGVTLTVNSSSVFVAGYINSKGTLKINGEVHFYEDKHFTGNVITGENGHMTMYGVVTGTDDIARFLNETSVYNTYKVLAAEDKQVVIDKDMVIPKGKYLTFGNYDHTLVVNKGVTLNNQGSIETYMKPIISGTLLGNPITVINH